MPTPPINYKLLSRGEARATGERHFFTGVPCSNGHTALRYTSSGCCVRCTRDIRDEHKRTGHILKIKRDRRGHYVGWSPTDVERALVRQMVANGISQRLICRCLGITENTLNKYCAFDLETGAVDANNAVANSLYFMATEGPIQQRLPAAIFWLKTRAGWREVEYVEMMRSPTEMTDEDLDKAIKLAEEAIRKSGRKRSGQRVVDLSAFRAGAARKA